MEPDFSINEVCLIAHRQRGIIFAVLINLIVNIIMRNAGLKVGFMDVSEADLQKFANPSSTL